MNSSHSKIIDDMVDLGRLSRSRSISNTQEEIKIPVKPSYDDDYMTTSIVLGKGSQGVVKKCVRKIDNKEFAVKIIYKSQMSQKDIRLLQREIAILKKLKTLKHNDKKYFIQLIDSYETNSVIRLVLNICKGGDLFDFLSNIHKNLPDSDGSCIDEDFFKKIFYQICRGVHVAHKNGIVHRDLKPENILFRDKNCTQINISDFGLSNINQSRMETRCGSPNYVAPEVLSGTPYTGKVDWWSCGVILYACLSGQYPFYSCNEKILYRRIICNDYNFNSRRWKKISPLAKDLISRLLKSDANERLSFSQILKHPWMQSLKLVPRNKSRSSSKNTSKQTTPIPPQENKQYWAEV